MHSFVFQRLHAYLITMLQPILFLTGCVILCGAGMKNKFKQNKSQPKASLIQDNVAMGDETKASILSIIALSLVV